MRKTSLLILAGAAAMSVASVASAASGINTHNLSGKALAVNCKLGNLPPLKKIVANNSEDSPVAWFLIEAAKKATCTFSIAGVQLGSADLLYKKPTMTITAHISAAANQYSITHSDNSGGAAQPFTDGQKITLAPSTTLLETITIAQK